MNADDGDLFKQIKTTSDASYKATTSDESLKNIAIAGATAGLTAGISEVSGLNDAVRAASAANAAGAANNTSTIAKQIQIAFAESALSTVSSTAAQSAINGDSFEETLKNQGVNILIGAAGNLGAKAIGNAAHGSYTVNENNQLIYIPPSIDKAKQLYTSWDFGVWNGATGGGDCASGAVSGIAGEEIGSYAYNDLGMNRNTAIQLGGLGGSFSAIISGNAVGLDDSEVAQNIWSGLRIWGNAAANNTTYVSRRTKRIIATPSGNLKSNLFSISGTLGKLKN
jgi:hypothetical protein